MYPGWEESVSAPVQPRLQGRSEFVFDRARQRAQQRGHGLFRFGAQNLADDFAASERLNAIASVSRDQGTEQPFASSAFEARREGVTGLQEFAMCEDRPGDFVDPDRVARAGE